MTVLASGFRELVEHHETVFRILVFAAIFAYGFFDAFVLKDRDLACVTWTLGLLPLSVWIAFALPVVGLIVGPLICASGFALMVAYYKKAGAGAEAEKQAELKRIRDNPSFGGPPRRLPWPQEDGQKK